MYEFITSLSWVDVLQILGWMVIVLMASVSAAWSGWNSDPFGMD